MAVTIVPGMKVIARSSFNGEIERRALTGVVDRRDFQVVWVCKESERSEAHESGIDAAEAIPWPAEDVWPAQES